MKKPSALKILTSFYSLLLLLALSPKAFAIGIQPIRQDINVEPGSSVQSTVTVVNETDKEFTAQPFVQVFYRNDETGAPIYPQADDLEIEDVRSWIQFPEEPVIVPAKGKTEVEYAINVPADAQAGGKYVSIAYQPVKDEAGSGVTVNVRAASLLLINVEGEIIKEGSVTKFGLPEELKSDQPFFLEVTFENTGNTHLKPNGWVELTDLVTNKPLKGVAQYKDPETGKMVLSDKIPVNLYLGNVLPGSLRTFKAEWTNNIQPGDYKAILNLEYADESGPITQSFDFGLNDKLVISDFQIKTEEKSAIFSAQVANFGIAHEKLSGVIAVKNVFGYTVSEIPLIDMGYLAPDTTENVEIEWLNKDIPKGRYTANLQLNYGFTEKKTDAEISFGEADRAQIYLISALIGVILIAAATILVILKKRKKMDTPV